MIQSALDATIAPVAAVTLSAGRPVADTTVPQVQKMIAQLLNGILKCDCPARIRRTMNRRLRRIEEARLYHRRCHKRLPPRRFETRRLQTKQN
jgi:hypothetical protein